MIKPYTYVAIHKNTGHFYYGVRFSNKCPPDKDLGKVYFTSSKTIRTIIEAEGTDAFGWFVRKEFTDVSSAVMWEYKVVRRILKYPKCLNRAVSPKNVPGNWFTDGTSNILGKYCPSGYRHGRTLTITNSYINSYQNRKRNRWRNNGKVSIFTEFAPSDQWVLGRLPVLKRGRHAKHLVGKKWWNNGVQHYRGNSPPDKHWVSGRMPHKINKQRLPVSDITKEKHHTSMIGRKWWNNGVVEYLTIRCPGIDFINGRLIKSKINMRKPKTSISKQP